MYGTKKKNYKCPEAQTKPNYRWKIFFIMRNVVAMENNYTGTVATFTEKNGRERINEKFHLEF